MDDNDLKEIIRSQLADIGIIATDRHFEHAINYYHAYNVPPDQLISYIIGMDMDQAAPLIPQPLPEDNALSRDPSSDSISHSSSSSGSNATPERNDSGPPGIDEPSAPSDDESDLPPLSLEPMPPFEEEEEDPRNQEEQPILRAIPLATSSLDANDMRAMLRVWAERRFRANMFQTQQTYSIDEILEIRNLLAGTISENAQIELISRNTNQLDVKKIIKNIDDVPLAMYKNYHDKKINEECLICYDCFVPTDIIRILQCGHILHRCCIDEQLQTKSHLCPYCNTPAGEYTYYNL